MRKDASDPSEQPIKLDQPRNVTLERMRVSTSFLVACASLHTPFPSEENASANAAFFSCVACSRDRIHAQIFSTSAGDIDRVLVCSTRISSTGVRTAAKPKTLPTANPAAKQIAIPRTKKRVSAFIPLPPPRGESAKVARLLPSGGKGRAVSAHPRHPVLEPHRAESIPWHDGWAYPKGQSARADAKTEEHPPPRALL